MLICFSDVLYRNGTAVDAAIATMLCNGAVIGHSMGLGGGFVMTIYSKSQGKVFNLMARETAPAAATMDMFVNNSKASSYGECSSHTSR